MRGEGRKVLLYSEIQQNNLEIEKHKNLEFAAGSVRPRSVTAERGKNMQIPSDGDSGASVIHAIAERALCGLLADAKPFLSVFRRLILQRGERGAFM